MDAEAIVGPVGESVEPEKPVFPLPPHPHRRQGRQPSRLATMAYSKIYLATLVPFVVQPAFALSASI